MKLNNILKYIRVSWISAFCPVKQFPTSRQRLLACFVFILVVFSAVFNPAYAALDLELTQGVDKAIPIAIVPFPQPEISEVINNDLQNSGRFHVMDPASISQNPHQADHVDYGYWQQQKMNNVVVADVITEGSQYKINFQLVDIYSKSVLLNKQFTATRNQFRIIAHRISDLIYEQLIGIRGVFSTKIAYVMVERQKGIPPKYNLVVADADGYNPKKLLTSTEPIMSPAWSPKGDRIAYVSFENGQSAIYIQELTSGKRRLLSRASGINGAPAWSPNGTKIALVLTTTGYPKIYTININSGAQEQLTSGLSLDTEPSFAPDGNSIIYTSNTGGTPQIYQMNLANKKVKRLTYDSNYNARGSFASDGKSIVMLNRRNNKFNIGVQDLESGRVNILADDGINKSPSFAPNGSMVVYATFKGNRGVLSEVSIDGKVKLLLPTEEGDVQEPTWSPFLN